jgi:hypothetical protein
MKSWKSRIAALMLLLVLPLQGLAAALAPLHCYTQKPAIESAVLSGAHDEAAHHGHGSDHAPAGQGNSDYTGHLCCHLAFTAVPAIAIPAIPAEPTAYVALASATASLFVPERLRRPPRA